MRALQEFPSRIGNLLRLAFVLLIAFLVLFNLHTWLQFKSIEQKSEAEFNQRLVLTGEAILRDLESSPPGFRINPIRLSGLKERWGVEQISLLDRHYRSLGDSYLHIERGDPYSLSGIDPSRVEELWAASAGSGTLISGLYKDGGGRLLKAVFLPLRGSSSEEMGMLRVTTRYADPREEGTWGATALLLKIFGGVGAVGFIYYGIRSVVVHQRRQIGPSAGIGTGNKEGEGERTDTTGFMIDTFQTLIERLKDKEQELERHRRVAEERADHIESYNENILRSVSSGVITFNHEEMITTFNLAAERILGLSGPSVIGRSCGEVFGKESRITPLVRNALTRGEVTIRQELELVRSSDLEEGGSPDANAGGWQRAGGQKTGGDPEFSPGKGPASEPRLSQGGPSGKGMGQNGQRREKIWVGVSTSLLMDRQNRVIGTTMIFTDISEIKRLQEQMELKKRLTMLGEMSAGIAHEFRNYMGTMLGYAKLLNKKIGSGHESSGMIRAIIQELEAMGQLINELLGFSRHTDLNLQPVNLRALIEKVIQQSFEQEKGPLPKLTLVLSSELGEIQADEVLIRQALGNLVQNALEAMPAGGELRVQAGVKSHSTRADLLLSGTGTTPSEGKDVVIEIQDTGEGIPLEVQDKIFLPFFTTKEKGTGLGLALVHKIILSHNGQIQVDSQHGRGTTFRVYLPVVS